ncbi:hypothetical protein TSOC_004126 [Tetrabaena socialis]|uniref:Uncharacterized protein n=1 Tax=Tetrabaena socialis TaxID=47790 RepID=A0A2J8A9U9_9CHLO|nr:hypothetical protein TSOC_004126 [Tetrabaena socialis]|eukprot:PNH09275.1 hypothetical protein TSOC_004126 [Tetrabaena socialis]
MAADPVRCEEQSGQQNGGGGGGGGGGGHIPLLRRQMEPSIEERMARRGITWPPVVPGAGAAPADDGEDAMLE